jgi:hypothetical protein
VSRNARQWEPISRAYTGRETESLYWVSEYGIVSAGQWMRLEKERLKKLGQTARVNGASGRFWLEVEVG